MFHFLILAAFPVIKKRKKLKRNVLLITGSQFSIKPEPMYKMLIAVLVRL